MEITWGLVWYYLSTDRMCICFCQVTSGTINLDCLNLILSTQNMNIYMMCLKQWLAHNNYYATIFFSFSLISLKNMEKEKGKKILKITYIALRILVCTRNKFSIFFHFIVSYIWNKLTNGKLYSSKSCTKWIKIIMCSPSIFHYGLYNHYANFLKRKNYNFLSAITLFYTFYYPVVLWQQYHFGDC